MRIAGTAQHRGQRHPQLVGHDLAYFGVQALAHLGAAVVHAHTAVQVDMHQRASLVKQRGGKADAELDGRDRQPPAHHRRAGIPAGHFLHALAVLRAALQAREQRRQDVVLHLHLVVRGIAAGSGARGQGLVAVQIAQAHIQGVLAQRAGDVAHDGFNQDHALRAAKAAKGGVALGVGFAAVGGDLHVLQKVRVVAVKNCAVGHRAGEVGAKAAVHRHVQLQAVQAPAVVVAHGVVAHHGVALAGNHEVVVAVQAQLDWRARDMGRYCGPHGHMAGLRFFAAKAAAHAPALHLHRVVVQTQGVRHPVLHFGRVLCAAVHRPLALVLGQRIRHLALQIKMLLPAHLQTAAQGMGGAVQGGLCIAAAHKNRRQHIALRGQGLLHGQHRWQGFDIEQHGARRAARLHNGARHHQTHHLADVLHRVSGKNGLVAGKRGQHRVAWNVCGQHDGHDAGHGAGGRAVHATQTAVGHGA